MITSDECFLVFFFLSSTDSNNNFSCFIDFKIFRWTDDFKVSSCKTSSKRYSDNLTTVLSSSIVEISQGQITRYW